MTEYVQEKVIDALKRAKGSRSSAKRTLAGLCATDEKFMHELVGQHLNSILDNAIHHYARIALVEIGAQKNAAKTAPKPPAEIGKEMLKRFAGQNTPLFGFDDPSQGTGKRPAASKRHKDAINLIAKHIDKTDIAK